MNTLAIRLINTRTAMLETLRAPVQDAPLHSPDTRLLEQTEIRSWGQYFLYCNPGLARGLGLSVLDCNDAKLFIAPALNILAFNRAMGLGSSSPVTRACIDDIVDTYHYAGAKRFMVQLAPGAHSAETAALLEQRGFTAHTKWVKWYRRLDTMQDESLRFDVQQIGRAHAWLYGDLAVQAFDWPREVLPLLSSTVGKRGWNHYIAYEDGVPVACAASYRNGKAGTLSFAGTIPSARGRGAHTALVKRRMIDLFLHGCEYAIVETAEPTATNPAPAHHNMQRMGFTRAYVRRNWVYGL